MSARRNAKGQNSTPSIPTAALLDVIFLLLVYFIVTAASPSAEAHVTTNLPSGKAGHSVQIICVTVLDGSILFGTKANQKRVTPEYLKDALAGISSTDPDSQILVRVSGKANQAQLVTVLDLCRSANLTKLNLVRLKE